MIAVIETSAAIVDAAIAVAACDSSGVDHERIPPSPLYTVQVESVCIGRASTQSRSIPCAGINLAQAVEAPLAHVVQSTAVMPTNPKARAIRQRLRARRRDLLAHYRNMLDLAEEEQSPEAELVDAASEQWDVRILSVMSDADARALGDVVAALQRLDAGCYGACTSCASRIEPERLRILPEAAECFECAEFAEQQHSRRVRAIG
jgi:RNA polymerase-binding transcription factor DksA